jgi:hypothetical protein
LAGRREASTDVAIANTTPRPTAHHGTFAASTTCPVACCSVGTYANQAARPSTAPATAPVTPTARPPVIMTRRRLRPVAPSALSMPRARSLRWAITEKPATDTRPMNTRPSTSTTKTRTAGEIPPDIMLGTVTVAVAGIPGSVAVPLPTACRTAREPSSTITWLGCRTWPGLTSANSSARLLGFCTMPVTRQVLPTARQVPPTRAPDRVATWLVSATWPGPAG